MNATILERLASTKEGEDQSLKLMTPHANTDAAQPFPGEDSVQSYAAMGAQGRNQLASVRACELTRCVGAKTAHSFFSRYFCAAATAGFVRKSTRPSLLTRE